MYLSKIELHGFKSFAQKIPLSFDPGITAIVGPNGCGKSNIVDAVRWVLGEQRARLLRSEKMENVIFNGTAKRRALGMAEVSLTIQNTRNVLPTEYSEVIITRRLYRSGESEYLLNDVVCRLKDILDLFMDTGMGANAYSIIELKMVDDILSENAQDRRRLFEEAAGITRYKLRRTQALRKLDNTQADLTRISDLTAEIEKQVRSLERQAKKASRYKDLRDRLERYELGLARLEYESLSRKRSSVSSQRASVNDRIEEVTGRLATQEASLEAYQAGLLDTERRLAERQRSLNSLLERLRRSESDLRLVEERVAAAQRSLERSGDEKMQAAGRRSQLEDESARLEDALLNARPELEAALVRLREAEGSREKARTAVDEARERLRRFRVNEQQAARRLSERKGERSRLENRIELLSEEVEEIQEREAGSVEKRASLNQRAAEAEFELLETRRRQQEARKDLEAARNLVRRKREAMDAVLAELRQSERRYEAISAEMRLLESLIRSYEEFSDTVQYLASSANWMSGAEPVTVSDMVSCAREDRLAIDAALGEYAQCFVVRSDAEARAAINLLHDQQKGQAAFFILDRLPDYASNGTFKSPNGAPAAAAVVDVDRAEHRKLTNLLLKDFFIVDDLEEARRAAREYGTDWPAARFVTRAGEWAGANGLIYGGSRTSDLPGASSRMARREQLAELQKQSAGLADDLAGRREALGTIEREIEKVPVVQHEKSLSEAEESYQNARQAHNQVVYELETRRRTDSEIAHRKNRILEEIDRLKEAVGDMAENIAGETQVLEKCRADIEESDEAVQQAELESRLAVGRHSEINVNVVEARNIADNIERDLRRVQSEIRLLDEKDAFREDEMQRYREAVTSGEGKQVELRERIASDVSDEAVLRQAVEEAETEVVQAKSRISEMEVVLREIRRMRENFMHDESRFQATLAEVNARLESLEERMQAEYSISSAEIPLSAGDFDEQEARREIPALRSRIRSLGAVNELALEDYETERERLDFMLEQKEDLENAEGTLLKTIKEINHTAAARFNETFRQIREHFGQIFSQLFTEGSAEVFLTDEGDPLESAIEIFARPQGKKPSTIAQLSGGEKTLTAIALLFGIYLVKPSPFCILDEVDAPLDDANINRFMKLIRDFSESTQFILVTHNKRTMEAADRMYGVTMEEEGVSRLVGVRFGRELPLAS